MIRTITIEVEQAHLRAVDNAVRYMRKLAEAEDVFLGAGCTDRTLTVEFLAELADRVRSELEVTPLRMVDGAPAGVTVIGRGSAA